MNTLYVPPSPSNMTVSSHERILRLGALATHISIFKGAIAWTGRGLEFKLIEPEEVETKMFSEILRIIGGDTSL